MGNEERLSVLVTGFDPFAGRGVNGSWLAAKSLWRRGDPAMQVSCLRLPVIWNEPLRLLRPIFEERPPDVVLSLGEGAEGRFSIETVAHQTGRQRQDNLGQYPVAGASDEPALRHASIDAEAVKARLQGDGFPVQISNDAGQFLCEQTLYVLEGLRAAHAPATTVAFAHVPPYQTELEVRQTRRSCDETLLAEFARALLASVVTEHQGG